MEENQGKEYLAMPFLRFFKKITNTGCSQTYKHFHKIGTRQ